MMIPISKLKDVKKPSIYKNKYGSYSNEIYTFDIETSSMFLINGKWQTFDKSIDNYDDIESRVCVYHCQFGINDKVYYFYNLSEFENVLKKISNPFLTKIIYIHNLSYEMAFLIPILKKYTVNNMIARQSHKPISFRIEELNIEFRCSLRLTELKLEKAGKEFTDVEKATGDLDYNVLRSPLSAKNMSEKEKYYCEMDIIVLYNVIKYYRKKYGSIYKIPYTQTGEMRRALKKVVPPSHYAFIKNMNPNIDVFKLLVECFWGAYVHANRLYIDELVYNVDSIDESSSYPFVLCTEKYPIEKFRKIKPTNYDNYTDDSYCKILTVKFTNIESKLFNNYIPFSKCRNLVNEVVDNRRIACADSLELSCTNIDFNLIKKCYSYSQCEIVECYVAKADFLPKYMIDFILDNYAMKTELKGIKGEEEMYMKAKQYNNSAYGACCTNYIKSSVIFDSEKLWVCPPLTDKIINEKLKEQEERPQLFTFAWGVFCTAYARRNLFERIIECNVFKNGINYRLDEDLLYDDTDSLKMINFDVYKEYFEKYNESCKRKMMNVAFYRNLDVKKFFPKDKKGNVHPLGYFDFDDGHYSEFKTLGSKRYCYRSKEDGELHIALSGVNKETGVKVLNDDINNFNFDLKFNYDYSGKLTHVYLEGYEPYSFIDNDGNEYFDDWGYGVVLQPTTYKMKDDELFQRFLDVCEEYSHRDFSYFEVRDKIKNTRNRK